MPRSNYIAFDCETSGVDDNDVINCIVSVECDAKGNRKVVEWYSELGTPISVEKTTKFVLYLWDLHNTHNYSILSFNGLSFDFKFIKRTIQASSDATLVDKVELLALNSEDIMFDFTTEFGYYTSMQSFATGCKLSGKTNTGAWASTAWNSQNPEEQQAVIKYCVDDVYTLCDIVDFRHDKGKLYRTTKKGKRNLWIPQSQTFRKVHDCITTFQASPVIPSWMDKDSAPPITQMWEWMS